MEVPKFHKTKRVSHRKPTAFERYWNRRRMWIAVTWSVLVMAVVLGYYVLVHLPVQSKIQNDLRRDEQAMTEKLEEARLEQEKERQIRWEQLQQQEKEKIDAQRERSAIRLENCLADAEATYAGIWDRECGVRGYNANCRLPDDISLSLNEHFGQLRDECFLRFPQEAPGLEPFNA